MIIMSLFNIIVLVKHKRYNSVNYTALAQSSWHKVHISEYNIFFLSFQPKYQTLSIQNPRSPNLTSVLKFIPSCVLYETDASPSVAAAPALTCTSVILLL